MSSTSPSLFFLRKQIDPCAWGHANLHCVSRLLRPPRRVPSDMAASNLWTGAAAGRHRMAARAVEALDTGGGL